MSVSLGMKEHGTAGPTRPMQQGASLGVRRSILLTPLLVVAVWFMWQKGCAPQKDVLPTAALTAHATAGVVSSQDQDDRRDGMNSVTTHGPVIARGDRGAVSSWRRGTELGPNEKTE